MKVFETTIPEVKILEPQVHGDERGFFMETFRDNWFREQVADVSFVQDNHSKSRRGILRGLHYQEQQPQGKLVRVVAGEVFDVAVDLRRSSPCFGRWFGYYLNAQDKRQLWVPPGFAHGFLVTSDYAEFLYKCTDYYHPESERTLAWDDPDLAIEWPLERVDEVILSEKDQKGLAFSDISGL